MNTRLDASADHRPSDQAHLVGQTQYLFPTAKIDVTYADGEIIHIDVDGHRFTFEIGSDDDYYLFSDGVTAFQVPLMKISEE